MTPHCQNNLEKEKVGGLTFQIPKLIIKLYHSKMLTLSQCSFNVNKWMFVEPYLFYYYVSQISIDIFAVYQMALGRVFILPNGFRSCSFSFLLTSVKKKPIQKGFCVEAYTKSIQTLRESFFF